MSLRVSMLSITRFLNRKDREMAKNGAKGGGRRGAVSKRSQIQNPNTDLWTKRDTSSGRFIATKKNGGPFKGVRKER